MRVTQSTYSRLYAQQTATSRDIISTLQQQIATGLRLQKPSDDPYSVGKTVQLEESLSHLDQYKRNGDFVDSRLSMEESAIRQISDKLTSLRESSILVNNDTLSAQDYKIYLEDIRHQRESVLGDINSQGPNGEYLFSGTERTIKPLDDQNSYQGNDATQMIKIGINNNLRVGTPAPRLTNFNTVTGPSDVLTTIDSLYSLLQDAADGNKPADFHSQMATYIEHLDDAQTHMATLQADVGHRLKRLDTARKDNADVQLMLNSDLNNIQGLDYADAISKLESEIQSLEAIQSTYSRLNNMSLFNYIS